MLHEFWDDPYNPCFINRNDGYNIQYTLENIYHMIFFHHATQSSASSQAVFFTIFEQQSQSRCIWCPRVHYYISRCGDCLGCLGTAYTTIRLAVLFLLQLSDPGEVQVLFNWLKCQEKNNKTGHTNGFFFLFFLGFWYDFKSSGITWKKK